MMEKIYKTMKSVGVWNLVLRYYFYSIGLGSRYIFNC